MMSACYPSEDTEHTLEGTASHTLGEALIVMGTMSKDYVVPADVRNDFIGQMCQNGVIYTEEMFDAAWEYAGDVVKVWRDKKLRGHNIEITPEGKVHSPTIHELSFGTSDSFLIDRTIKELTVWDYKYGMSVVEAFENWQGINYVSAIFDTYGLLDFEYTVRIKIVQPRAYHRQGTIREWVISGSDLRPYINKLHNGAQRALGQNPEAKTGSHCKHCEARHACMPALEAGFNLFEVARKTLPVNIGDDTMGIQLSIIKRAIEQLQYLESGYEAQITAKIKKGIGIKGWSLEPSFGRRKWNQPYENIVAIGDMMGIDLRKQELITPLQAKDKGLDEAFIGTYSETPVTGSKLVQSNKSTAQSIFRNERNK